MISVIIVGAGSGKRMGIDLNKIFLDLNGKPVLFHSIDAFNKRDDIDEIILVLKENEIDYYNENFEKYHFSKVRKIVAGGSERMYSVFEGLKNIDPLSKIVLIHDAARPLVSQKLIDEVIEGVKEFGAATPGVIPKDTIKVSNEKELIRDNLDRNDLRIIQTPQGFISDELMKYYCEEINNDKVFTDDTYLYFNKGKNVKITRGDYKNIKITTLEDIEIARLLME